MEKTRSLHRAAYRVAPTEFGEGLVASTTLPPSYCICSAHYREVGKPRRGDPAWDWLFTVDGKWRIVFGDPALLNHSDEPNVHLVWNERERICRVFSSRIVKAGEELFMQYANWEDYKHDKK